MNKYGIRYFLKNITLLIINHKKINVLCKINWKIRLKSSCIKEFNLQSHQLKKNYYPPLKYF